MLKPQRETRRQTRMRNKWLKRFFPILALLLLIPWPIAYAYDVDGALAGQDAVQIEVAEVSAQPTWSVFGGAIGNAAPGDLFYVDATSNSSDIKVTLHLTNASQLINCYTYLVLEVGVCVESGAGEWEKASGSNGEPLLDTFITMRDGRVSFALPGLAKYKVAIDGGSFYCATTDTDSGSLLPQFYLSVD
jgi:hypothetical protein